MKVSVGVSNHHVHLTHDSILKLFGSELVIDHNLTQMNNYASKNFVTIKTDKSTIEHVRVIGPARDYNQIEISKTDAYKLGINPPVRSSGDLLGSEVVTLIGPKGSIKTTGCIIADRHIHITQELKDVYKLPDTVKIKIDNEKKGIIEAHLKISDEAVFELHIDTDDANAFLLSNGDFLDII